MKHVGATPPQDKLICEGSGLFPKGDHYTSRVVYIFPWAVLVEVKEVCCNFVRIPNLVCGLDRATEIWVPKFWGVGFVSTRGSACEQIVQRINEAL